jgi:peptidoglycan/xylan/chitin deacetylase (PgdA/CDA1 family)
LPPLVVIVVLLAALYLVWRVRYGTPPSKWPQVLCFHKISSQFCWEGTWKTPGGFFSCIDHLLETGYQFVGIDEYLDSARPDGPGGGRKLLLTFDDGYSELYDVVLPGLESRGVPLHVFLVTDYIGRNNDWDLSLGRRPHGHLGWAQIEEMAKRGVTFGSHGASHGDLSAMEETDVLDDLARSKKEIEDRLGGPVRTVSYPFGRYNQTVKKVTREAGYDAAFSLYPAHHNSTFDPFAIRRNAVYIIDPAEWIQTKLLPGPMFWLEEMKCRAINGVAALTPAIKSLSRRAPGRDT